ncbi:MAG: hypothetical protein IPO88_08020 [Nannocystis sp.]|uniref:hypothetical protein n=1 Tax=Nannocystis sp. TaxID=1962667 RepID=UPI0024210261|nr:hypothetical protein [Nannocystis sp.]MBK9753438.1 hypothetical protein [Nannocystis sp.]
MQSESGVDLLKKIPLSEQVRDQVSITIEARFIRNKKAMDIARRILKEVTKVAEPYLNSYPIASKIIGSAVPLIDELTPNERSAPSATTTMIVAEDFNGNSTKLVAFGLLPFKAKDDPKGRRELNSMKLIECDDMPGTLCTGGPPGGTAAHRASEADPGPTADGFDELRRLGDLLLQYRSRLSDPCSATGPASAVGLCDDFKVALERFKTLAKATSPDVVILDVPGITSLGSEGMRALLTAYVDTYNKRLVEKIQAKPGLLYQTDQVTPVVYLTISFRGYGTVFDPMVLLRDAMSDCDQVTVTSIQQARDYLSANEDLFAPEDVDRAKKTFRLARLLITLREHASKRSVDEFIAALESAKPRVGQTSTLQKTDSEALARHLRAVEQCLTETMRTSPADVLLDVWRLAHTAAGYEAPTRDLVQADAVRLDLIGQTLRDLAAISGTATEYNETQPEPFPKLSSPLVSLLHREATGLLARQKKMDLSKGSCQAVPEIEELAQQASLYCESCWQEIDKACVGKFPNIATILQTHKSRRKQRWAQNALNAPAISFSDGPD